MSTDMLKMRDYQNECVDHVLSRFADGGVRVPNVLATGLGKTVIFAHLAKIFSATNRGKRVLVLVHTDELVQQAKAKMSQIAPHLTIGIVKAAQNEVTAHVIIASVQSLRSERRRNAIRNVGLIIVDECFPAGTLIGGKSIETLRPGDMVPSWDEESGREVLRPVVRLMKRKPAGMLRVSLVDGTNFACTPNHPIMTSAGWCPAGGLWRGAEVLSFTHDATARDLYGMQDRVRYSDTTEVPAGRLPEEWPDVLPAGVSGCVGSAGSVGAHESDERSARIGAHEGAQSDGAAGVTREDVCDIAEDRAQATRPGWQWEADARAAEALGCASGLAYGGDGGASGWGASVSLQAGHRASDDEGMRGGGRGVPLLAGSPKLRPEAGRAAVFTRVAGIQVLESGGDGTYGGVCPDGFVYNIEVAGTHTYLVGERGTVAHNCHHATAPTYRTILEHYGAFGRQCVCEDLRYRRQCTCWASGSPKPDVFVAGFTATLARGDKAKLSDVWESDPPPFTRGIGFGIRRGYLLDVRGKRIEVPDLELGNVKKQGGDYADASLADELDRSFAPQIVAEKYAELAGERKGLVFTPTVESAEHFATAFNDAGVPAAVVHGKLAREERRLILKRLAAGDIRVVVNCAVLTEGFDDPTISCVVIARPTRSAPLYQQMVGRGLRPDLSLPPDGRGDCLVLDVVGASRSHDLRSLVDLSEKEIPDEALDDELSLLELEELGEELEKEEHGSVIPEQEYVGETEAVDFDPLGRTTAGAWLTTFDGTYFLPIGRKAYVLLVPNEEEPNTWDVGWLAKEPGQYGYLSCPQATAYSKRFGRSRWCGCGQKHEGAQGDLTEHRGLSLAMACSWAEEVMEKVAGKAIAQQVAGARQPWRTERPNITLLRTAWDLRIPTIGLNKGDLADAVEILTASGRIDPVIAFMKMSRESEAQ